MAISQAWSVLKETAVDWYDDRAPRLAASLAYYALLSAAPLILLVISIAGLAFGDEAARGQIARAIGGVVGEQAAVGIQSIANAVHQTDSGVVGSVVGIAVLLFGASGAFGELQAALNEICKVAPKPGRGWRGLVFDRFFSFAMVMGVAFLLMVSLVVSAALSALGTFLQNSLPGGEAVWQVLNFVISLGVVTFLFALIMKFVPDAQIRWRDVWVGAAVTALLFIVGKTAFGLYLGKSNIASSYGAASSLVALVLWIYYSSQILFFGAEFTQVYARRFGAAVKPGKNAVSAD
jgi:membrane protein